MFIYNYIAKKWEEKGFYVLFCCTILFFITYWFLFTMDNEDGTYNKIEINPIKLLLDTPPPPSTLLQHQYIPNYPKPKTYNRTLIDNKGSKGERECRRVLETIFKRPFPNVRPRFMRNEVTGENLELDMYNPELRLACEYNGQQHYKFNKWMHKGNSSNFQNQQYRDIMKRDLCQKNNINLIEVPYTVKHHDIQYYIINKLKNLNYI